MFSAWTQFLFNQANENLHKADQREDAVKSLVLDEDWVLVEKFIGEDLDRRQSCIVLQRSLSLALSDTSSSSTDTTTITEGGWWLTPPPCFTLDGFGPSGMEAHPLEDLLIEHPSMSVYGSVEQRNKASHRIRSNDTEAAPVINNNNRLSGHTERWARKNKLHQRWNLCNGIGKHLCKREGSRSSTLKSSWVANKNWTNLPLHITIQQPVKLPKSSNHRARI